MLDLVVNRVPIPIRDAIARRGGSLIALYEVDHPDGVFRVWSGAGTLQYQNEKWSGAGDLISVDGIGGSRKTEVRVVTATLAGVTQRQLAMVTKQVRGREARMSLAALREDQRAVNGDAYSICYGLCDTQDHKVDEKCNCTIQLTINQPLFILDRAPNIAWTPDWLKAAYGEAISGLDDLPGVASRNESWTKN